MRPCLWLVLVITLLPGCDIDFVAVEDATRGSVTLRTEHAGVAGATLDVMLPSGAVLPRVLLDGTELAGDHDGRHWRYRATPAIDTLRPGLELAIFAPDELRLVLPFLTRSGAAVRRQNGDLEIPIVYGGDPQDPRLTWSLELVDSLGNHRVRIDSRAAGVPNLIVLDGTLIPEGTVAAEIMASRHEVFAEGMYAVAVVIHGIVRVPIPTSPSPGMSRSKACRKNSRHAQRTASASARCEMLSGSTTQEAPAGPDCHQGFSIASWALL